MKILLCNKFYRPVGGPETMVRRISRTLERAGHQVIPFSMQHPDNWPSEWSRYFVSNVDYTKGSYGPLRLASEAIRMVYSVEARRKIEALIAEVRPDVAHLHNIYHQISPSILPALNRAGVATVLTLHDGKLMCPAYHFMVNGRICERCGGRRFYNCLARRCVRSSLVKSLLCTVETYLHRWVRIYERNIDLFVAPSEFYRSLLVASGRVPPERVITIHTDVIVDSVEPSPPGDYAVYVGRVEAHKGVLTLIDAMERCPSVQLRIIGSGNAEEECARRIREKRLSNVTLMGFQTGAALEETLKGASFLVAPSEWYENCPAVVLEAAAHGKPAVVTRLGGLPELVEDGKTGFVVEPYRPDELAQKIRALAEDPDLVREMGRAARTRAEQEFSHTVHCQRILEVYSRAIEECRARRAAHS